MNMNLMRMLLGGLGFGGSGFPQEQQTQAPDPEPIPFLKPQQGKASPVKANSSTIYGPTQFIDPDTGEADVKGYTDYLKYLRRNDWSIDGRSDDSQESFIGAQLDKLREEGLATKLFAERQRRVEAREQAKSMEQQIRNSLMSKLLGGL